jgi:hypothetical protein
LRGSPTLTGKLRPLLTDGVENVVNHDFLQQKGARRR